jgi:hypothetical protein
MPQLLDPWDVCPDEHHGLQGNCPSPEEKKKHVLSLPLHDEQPGEGYQLRPPFPRYHDLDLEMGWSKVC